MTPIGFDRPITAWLEDEAAMRAPDDLLPLVLDRAPHTKRRPGWATTGRWISMETRAQLGAAPRSVIILATLGLLTALAAAIAYAAGQPEALRPTGPAANGLIAYSSDGDLWVVNPDGTGRRQLTTGPADDHTPVWSRDGTRLVYWSVDPSGSATNLVVMDADGSDPAAIFTDERGRTSLPIDWSPDGERIAFTLCPDIACGELYVVEADGTGSSMLGGPAFEANRLLWSPDGKTIAFGGRHGSEPRGVFLMSPEGTDVRRISRVSSPEPRHFGTLEWWSDGSRVLTHAGENGGEPDIWLIEADGSGEKNVTEGPATGFFPRLSPDDEWVAFRDGETIYLLPSAGGQAEAIGQATDHHWSPDGTALALGGVGGVRIVDVATGDRIDAFEGGVEAVDSWQRVAP